MENATTIALSRLVAQQRAMDVTAANIANANTPGFRTERMMFSDFLVRQQRRTAPSADRLWPTPRTAPPTATAMPVR